MSTLSLNFEVRENIGSYNVGSFYNFCFPSGNKNNTIAEYWEEAKREFYTNKCKVCKILFLHPEEMDFFENNLLSGCEAFEKIGGSCSDAPEFDGMEYLQFIAAIQTEPLRSVWNTTRYTAVVLVSDGVRFYAVNTEGYDYARYVGLIISPEMVTEWAIEEEKEDQRKQEEVERRKAMQLQKQKEARLFLECNLSADVCAVIVASRNSWTHDLGSDYGTTTTDETFVLCESKSKRATKKELYNAMEVLPELKDFQYCEYSAPIRLESYKWEVKKISGTKEQIIDQLIYLDFKGSESFKAARPDKFAVSAAFEMVDYSEKAVALFGDTKDIKERLKALNGRFNPALNYNGAKRAGWIFSKRQESALSDLILDLSK